MVSQKNVSFIVGIAIPIFMIVLVALSIYLPSLFAPAPQFNFIYVSEDNYGHQSQIAFENGVLVKREVKHPESYTPQEPRLFIYDVMENTDQEITFEEAQKLKLDSRLRSPDGYEVVYGSHDGGFFPLFYGGSDYNAMYLKGHHTSKKLDLQASTDSRCYYRNRHFLAWIR